LYIGLFRLNPVNYILNAVYSYLLVGLYASSISIPCIFDADLTRSLWIVSIRIRDVCCYLTPVGTLDFLKSTFEKDELFSNFSRVRSWTGEDSEQDEPPAVCESCGGGEQEQDVLATPHRSIEEGFFLRHSTTTTAEAGSRKAGVFFISIH
jgi:hypothetical protein